MYCLVTDAELWQPKMIKILQLLLFLLFGEKPHLADKYTHIKFLAFPVQAFILKTKRLIAYNKPRPVPNAPPTHESDWCILLFLIYFSVCQLSLFNFCVFWYYLIIKLNVPQVLSNRLNIFTIVITFDPSDHSYAVCVCVCVCFCVRVIYASHFSLIAIYENNAFDLTATL